MGPTPQGGDWRAPAAPPPQVAAREGEGGEHEHWLQAHSNGTVMTLCISLDDLWTV